MRIGLNLLYLLPGIVGGTQTYAVSLIRALVALDTENEYLLYLNRESEGMEITDAPNVHRIVCPVRAIRRAARFGFEQMALPLALRRDRVDLLHSMGYIGPLYTHCPHVVSIHDLIYRGHGAGMAASKQKTLEFFVKNVARRANHVLTLSESSKQQIVSDIAVPPEKVSVIYLAARPEGDHFSPESRAPLLTQYGITRPYLIAFSSPNPLKNILRLVQAFAQACSDLPHQLVLVGHIPPETDIRAEAKSLGMADRVIITGYVPDEHIAPLLQGAELFVFPSRYEGFGLPLLDAQQAGVPVISSNAASLPEVAGEGAILFDPLSVPEMAAAIRSCLQNSELRRDLIRRGRENLCRFSWKKAARETLNVYRQVRP